MMNPNNQNLNQEKMNDLDQPTMTGASVAGSSAVSAAYDADEDEPVPAHKANIPKGKGRAEYAGLPSDPDSDDPYDSNDGFAFPLNVTDHQKIEWRQFHERIAVHAVLKNRLIDLKILIDTEFAKKIYNHAWNSMAPNFRKLWLMEIKILAEERKTAFLELAGKSIDTSDTSAQILVNAKEIALRRLRSMYIEVNDQRQPNPRFVSIMNEYFDSMIESVEMDKSFVNSIDKGSYEAEIKRLFAIIDKVDIHLSRVEERNVPSYFDVWYEKDINKHERYYTLLMLHVSEAKAPYLYPEPFGSFLRSLRDATSLEALKNFMMTSASSQDSAQDLLPDPDLGVALEAERLREQLIPNGVILKEEEDNDRIKVCESLMRKTEDAAEADAYRIEIAEIQMRKSARLEKLRISIFKRSICRFHMVAVSPNYVLSDALVEDANKTMEANLTSGYGQLSEKFSQISRRYTEQEVGYGFRREDLKSIGTIEETRQMIARAATVHTNHVHQMPQIQSDWARALKESQERERLKDATIQRLERAMESNTTRTERIEATLVAILQQMQPRPEQGQASSGAGVHFTAPHAGQTEGSQQQLPANGL